jgi:hypothetical protein
MVGIVSLARLLIFVFSSFQKEEKRLPSQNFKNDAKREVIIYSR